MPSELQKYLSSAGSGAVVGGKIGGPPGAAIGAGAGLILEFLQREPTFDDSAYREAFAKVRDVYLRQAGDLADEAGSAAGTDFAVRGISGDLAEGAVAGQRRYAEQSTRDALAVAEANLEVDIANARAQVDAQNRERVNRNLANFVTLGSDFAYDILNPNPYKQDSQGVLQFRELFGIKTPPKHDLTEIFKINDVDVPAGSGAGQLNMTAPDLLQALADKLSGGITEIMSIMGN